MPKQHARNTNLKTAEVTTTPAALGEPATPAREFEWLTYPEAAAFLNITINTLYWLVSQKRMPHTRLGKKLVRFSRTALKKWMAERAVDVRAADSAA